MTIKWLNLKFRVERVFGGLTTLWLSFFHHKGAEEFFKVLLVDHFVVFFFTTRVHKRTQKFF